MEFASILRELASTHERECEQRRALEVQLQIVQEELERLRSHRSEAASEQTEGQKHRAVLEELVVERNELAERRCSAAEEGSNCTDYQGAETAGIGTDDMHCLDAPMSGCSASHRRRLRTYADSDVTELALMKGWKRIDSSKNGNTPNSIPLSEIMNSASFSRVLTRVASIRRLSDGRRINYLQRKARDILESRYFDALSASAITANAILIGCSGDYAARHRIRVDEVPNHFIIAERAFTCIFLVELILRLLEGPNFFLSRENRWWNVFDMAVVAGDFSTTVYGLVADDAGPDVSILRMLRIVRVTRAVRVIRLVRFFKELRMMVYSILRCGTSMLWALLLFFIITYIFGMFMMTQVSDYLANEGRDHPRASNMRDFFGSVPLTVYGLYACISGGISWKEVSDDLIEIHWSNGAALSFFVFFTLFIVANILTGIFVDTAIQSASSDRDAIIQEQILNQESELQMLKITFEEADQDSSGTITNEEFTKHLDDEKVRAHFTHMGIEVHEAIGLFKLLDQDHSGAIGIQEFCMGCLRLKGGAKGIDLATLMYENKRLVERIKELEIFCQEQFTHLSKYTEAIISQLGSKSPGHQHFDDQGLPAGLKPNGRNQLLI